MCSTGNDDDTKTPTASPPGGDDFKIHKGKGYCKNKDEEQFDEKVTSGKKCWNKCKDVYGYEYAELTDEVCFCQKKCNCMEEGGTIAIVPSMFQLPTKC